jgi:hypothetical protein
VGPSAVSEPSATAPRDVRDASRNDPGTLLASVQSTIAWVRRQLFYAAVLVGAALVVLSYVSGISQPLPESALFLVRHIAVALVIGGLGALLVPRLLKKDELKDAIINFLREEIVDAIEDQTNSIVRGAQSLETIRTVGISSVYASRSDADADMAEDIESASEIRVLGLSLEDMRGHNATLPKSWQALRRVITNRPGDDTPCRVKVLVIDPNSLGAALRSQGEGDLGSISELRNDVNQAVVDLKRLQEQHGEVGGERFDFKLYRVAPQLFFCHTGSVAYVQPYYFRGPRSERRGQPPLPMLRCEAKDVLADLENHFDLIWHLAAITADDYREGQGIGIEMGSFSAAVANVYTGADEAARRMQHLIHQPGGNVDRRLWLQGISLDSYFRSGMLFEAVKEAVKRGWDVRILLLHPYSVQARYRSYREYVLDPNVDPLSFADYCRTPRIHETSDLVLDTIKTVRRINSLRRAGHENIRAQLYASAPFCFMLLTAESAMVEQYHYGTRDGDEDDDDERIILGKDMPIVEYRKELDAPTAWRRSRTPYGLLKNHFEFVWNAAGIADEATDDDVDPVTGPDRARALEMVAGGSELPA